MEGATYYYFAIPKNPANDWLVAEHQKRFNAPPDFFTADGMATGIALVAALEKTKGDTDAETLIPAMEGMEFDSPKGRMQFRAAGPPGAAGDVRLPLKVDSGVPWAVPELTRDVRHRRHEIPIANKR